MKTKNINESLPLYVRIAERAKDELLIGTFEEEVQLPSTTYLSKKYGINVATINKALALLVEQDLVYKKRGVGMFVRKGAINRLVKERRKTFRENYLKRTILEAKKLRYTFEEYKQLVIETFTEIYGHDPYSPIRDAIPEEE